MPHRKRTLPPFPVCQPASAATASCRLRPRRLEPSRPHGPCCRPPRPGPSLTPIFLPPLSTEPTSPPPPISLPCSPSRAHRFGEAVGASLCSILHPHPSLSSPPSPPPTRPPCQLPPPETPPPLWFLSEHRHHLPLSVSTAACSLYVQMDSPLTFSIHPQHCRATPSTSSITGASSPPLNTAAQVSSTRTALPDVPPSTL
jgi:hypothetical protein